MFINIILKFLFVTVRDRNIIFSEYDSSFVDNFYFLFLYDKRPVYTDKLVGRKLFFHDTHADQWQDRSVFILKMNFDIVFQAFYV